MKSMEMTPDAKDKADAAMPEMEQPKYPYGLQISLNDETIEALGIDTMPEIGTALMLHAKVKVIGVMSNEVLKDNDSTPERRIELQITDMEMMSEAEKKPQAEVLYGKG